MMQAAETEFQKDYYKLDNNALFVKTMENMRRLNNFLICQSKKEFVIYSSRPEFLNFTIFNEKLVGVYQAKFKWCRIRQLELGRPC